MKIGDLVKCNLNDQLGIVIAESRKVSYSTGKVREALKPHSFRVEWSDGSYEWTGNAFVEVISEAI